MALTITLAEERDLHTASSYNSPRVHRPTLAARFRRSLAKGADNSRRCLGRHIFEYTNKMAPDSV